MVIVGADTDQTSVGDPKDGDETTELKTRGSNVNPHSHVNTQHDVTTHPRSEIEPFIQINCDNTCV
ncbi:hypothetical protein MAR_006540 [Mya arenaria]|uniref:Uncharacterized protein n=1 Tax=Mya arenaria TaxID=6604 RepID=A0ABY7DCG0_MYAAR|nr:hypothetical protein MAR_006540 [Mya arenaria]